MNANRLVEALPLAELGVFAAVAELEGFSAAARRLNASKAMVSTAVSRLERRLGVRLLQRTTRRLSLPEDGAAVLPHAQRLLQAAADAIEAAGRSQAEPQGTLRLSVPMSFGLLHVVPMLGAFGKAHPLLRVDLVLDDRLLDLVEGAFDLAVRIGPMSDSALVAQRIGTNRSLLVAAPSYLARAGTPRVPADLAAHITLAYSLAATGEVWKLTRGKQTHTVRSRPHLKANSSLALYAAVKQGLGIARIPSFVVGQDVAKKRLERVLPEWELPSSGIHLVTTARDLLPRKTRAFIDFFRARIGEPPSWEEPTGVASGRVGDSPSLRPRRASRGAARRGPAPPGGPGASASSSRPAAR